MQSSLDEFISSTGLSSSKDHFDDMSGQYTLDGYNSDSDLLEIVDSPKTHNVSTPDATSNASRSEGRPRSKVWEAFAHQRGQKRHLDRAICNFCGESIAGRPTAMEAHLLTCRERKKRKIDLEQYQIDSGKLQVKPGILTKKTSKGYNENMCNLLLCRLIVGCGLSLSIADHPFFKEYLSHVNNGYKPPSTWSVRNELLPRYYAGIVSEREDWVKEQKVLTLALDGWTARSGEGIYALTLISQSGEEVLYHTFTHTTEAVTARYLANKVAEVINEIGSNKFIAVCTDSASNCSSMRDLIHDEFPNICGFACFVHWLNLLCKDIVNVKAIKEIVSSCDNIITAINSSTKLSSAIKEKAQSEGRTSRKVALAGKTRFSTIYECLRSLSAVRLDLIAVVSTDKTLVSKRTYNLLLDSTLFSKIESTEALLRPIVQALKASEASKFSPSDAYFTMLKVVYDMSNMLRGDLYEDGLIKHVSSR
jgi:hypothetical protein